MSENKISATLISWYQINKRELPWREINDPYKIWVSEIILQQTRVQQGIDYYYRFIERFPNIKSLASAHEDEVLKYWQGLGYYSRARNMLKAAQQISNEYNGQFPNQFEDILKLKGIGIYTASAISSFAFHLPHAVVDGNVYRVLSRLFDIEIPIDTGKGQKYFAELAQELFDRNKPSDHNQAIMEFGALQCVPNTPNCEICVLKDLCLAYKNNTVTQLPIKTQKVKIKKRYFNYLHIVFQDKTYFKQRIESDIWQNLFEFPLIETNKLLTMEELLIDSEFKSLFKGIDSVSINKIHTAKKHILSHRQIFAQFISITVDEKNDRIEQLIEVDENTKDNYAVSRLMELFFEEK
jgi:A/G-specific adenine glycosylase